MNELFYLFLVIAIGYLIGRIRIKGVGLGISAILLVALVFGHFGVTVSSIVKNLGLALFVTAVGHITGPKFIENCKKSAVYYIIIGISMIVVASLLCAIAINLFKLPIPLSLGLLAGALSSTPCLATALEITQDSLASIGYGIAYPFGVVGVVLAVQLISKIEKDDRKKETSISSNDFDNNIKLIEIDRNGFFSFALSLALGILIGNIKVPLPGNLSFSLGISGGVLLTGLVFGTIKKVGNISITVNKNMLSAFRELGLAIFLAGAGIEAGSGFIETINQYGIVLFLVGMVLTLVPIVFGFFLAHSLFKLDLFASLGTVCGGMTSTSALGSLSELDGYDEIAAGYAATYSIALISIIIAVQILYIVFA